ncbi:hypothetical protein AAC387_Pa07g0602 [Persea americana]
MDKSWIDLPNKMSREYMDGINQFMEFTNGFDNEFISCPCRKCANRYYYRREFVREHLILNGFLKQYKNWIRHGEEYVSCRREERDETEVDDMSEADPMIAMLNDFVCGLAPEYTSCETEGAGGSNPRSDVDEEALRYFEILDDAQIKLNENAHLDTCIVCQTSRWKEDRVGYSRQNSSTSVVNRGKRVAAKQ